MSVRNDLAVQLRAKLLPKRKYNVVAYERNLDVLTGVTIMLKQSRIEKSPVAPMSKLLTTFTLTVITPQTDTVKAEDELDEQVGLVCLALDSLTWLKWTDATKVLFNDSNLAYDITVEVTSTKEP